MLFNTITIGCIQPISSTLEIVFAALKSWAFQKVLHKIVDFYDLILVIYYNFESIFMVQLA